MGQPGERGRRIARVECGDNYRAVTGYGTPISGLVVVVDLTSETVIRVTDSDTPPLGADRGDWDQETIGPTRPPLKPLTITQAQGPSFSIKGGEVSWDRWRFHLRTDMRRGVVVSLVRFQDGERERSVMYQGSVSELFVPYQDPSDRWAHTLYFDLGSYPGLFEGVAGSLEAGADCPAHAVMVDGIVAGMKGEPRLKPRVACLFERAGGEPAWRHGLGFGRADSRPRRDLVLRMITHAGNYDYIFDWTFLQDGTIKVQVGATGIMQTKSARAKTGTVAEDAYGRYVSPNQVAVNHSHFLSFRIDLDVDGQANSLIVERLKTETLPASNPRRSVWKAEGSVARTEQDGMLMSTMAEPQVWRFANPAVPGVAGDPVAYQVAVEHGAMSLMTPDDWFVKRGGFINHMLWVTPYQADELYAAGDFPTRSTGGDGLPAWTAANRGIENTDLVAWVTLGFHHVPRVEDWPVMPVAWHGFEIRPNGFFTRNPALDLPK
jgi:primary-amine oxidase